MARSGRKCAPIRLFRTANGRHLHAACDALVNNSQTNPGILSGPVQALRNHHLFLFLLYPETSCFLVPVNSSKTCHVRLRTVPAQPRPPGALRPAPRRGQHPRDADAVREQDPLRQP